MVPIKLFSLAAAILSIAAVLAAPTSNDQLVLESKKPRPLVIWHGLGDTALSSGISSFIEDIKSIHPGIFVHSVQIPEGGSLDDERRAGFWGNAEDQGWEGCEQIASIPELEGGFDGMGFSQGGLFLRFYAQYCDGPPMNNLITFGTPHFGISALIPCPTPPTLSCLLAARAARAGIYTPYAQTHIVQAAYFRDTERLDEFWEVNSFIRDLNGEKEKGKNGSGKGVYGLENFVAVMFDQDRTVSPAQSAHFATYSPSNKTLIIPMDEQPMYTGDWIGLRSLDSKGGLKLEHCPGEHMNLGGEGGCGERMVRDWVGWAA
uniref:Palmitoyl-protein thioesterase 1 n=1 Tax=Kwoniella bestiolae CBS 10118 TaxID=1296100 RepID=A0A1B9G1N1_9TREE|nr:palmitoyl-protein thioesterase [Kwoniella bestiolae CBS 10118]OCF24926.1 palmitoyl-protein thioesterase [Kwoniella bestiolae CBS 10118]